MAKPTQDESTPQYTKNITRK